MRRRFRAGPACTAAALLLTVLCTGQAPAAAPPGRADLDPVTVERLDGAIQAAMRQAGIPGVNVGLWIDGRGDYVRAFGVSEKSSGTPMKTDLFSRIGSVTKTFTITALLRLVDAGRVGLDDPVSDYVPGVPGGDAITVRQLADMRSGLYDYTDDQKLLTTMKADPHRSWSPRQLLDIAFSHPAGFAPGTKWQYSNTNTVLLGLLIEKVSGKKLGDYIRQEVLGPVGLEDTVFPTDSTIPDPYAHGYTDFTPSGKTADASRWNPSWAWAAGAMISDLDDLHTWVPALVSGRLPDGKPLVKPATQAQRLAVEPTGHPGIKYGLGIMEVNGWFGHNGELPGYESLTIRLPSQGATLVVLINSDIDGTTGSLSSLIGRTVTEIATPAHPFTVPAAARPKAPSPDSSPSSPAPSPNRSPGPPR
ncbi:serine hydrolase [Streptomyces venezuelae]|uniref:Serine hydrolase n=1 Tax=Streptomyces venezuelae TaxID=54571 RepID=A0A5P2D6R7_STRVZ|nr:serine hydrolase domain-containing protein [Streptomyces venezuelae]QES48829.1 serine hydrolase [Streptomyces venezuelae]